MGKSPDAFRTISEVADWLGIQAHVLRFWESKFTQVRPVKRAGGRRYYRPGDMLLLGGIKQLLHEDGLTIKGVQKILREEGMSHVSALSQPLDELTQSQMEDVPEATFIDVPEEPAEETGVVLSFESPPQKTEAASAPEAPAEVVVEDVVEPVKTEAPAAAQPDEPISAPIETATPEAEPVSDGGDKTTVPEAENIQIAEPAPQPPVDEVPSEPEITAAEPEQDEPEAAESVEPAETAPREMIAEDKSAEEALEPPVAAATDEEVELTQETTETAPLEPDLQQARAEPSPEPTEPAEQGEKAEPEEPDESDGASLPAFLRRLMPDQPVPEDNTPPAAEAETETESESTQVEPTEPAPPPAPVPRVIDVPPLTPHDQIAAAPSILSTVHATRHLNHEQARKIAPLLDKLVILRDSMAARRKGGGPNA
ncbi:Transcriptional regulator, MerR family [Sulfitobacter noctilucae]|uniref:MerR family transcriptional regulator n=1 Tax=Sulfitobacter noctilucae TaxID=1342302 RepID=UPI00046AB50B|nr:MerR family transcriptional regulator [Sulfitobacter noctilucae]KIN61278.1 Transcriptional regulator, MerR family [Sulfitobacter noctilucae]